MKNLPIALQLYSVREEMGKDFMGTIERVAKMGYDGVEFAGYGGYTAAEIKAQLDRLGIKVAGSHISIDNIENNLEAVIEFEKGIGNKYIVCPYATVDTREKLNRLMDVMRTAGKRLKDEGLTLCYHNHAHEFVEYDGRYALDILYMDLADVLQTEIDTFWVKKAGIDPIAYYKKYSGCSPLVHIKDMNAAESESTEVGNGIMDIRGLVEASDECGTEWLVIEQEEYTMPPIECVEIGLNNLRKITKEV